MTQANKLPNRVVTVTVRGHVLHNGKPATQLDIPDWKAKYPVVLYGTTPGQQAEMPMGKTLRVVLQADKLKEGADGSKPWDYFWTFVGIAAEDEGVDDSPPSDSGPEIPAGIYHGQEHKPAPKVRDQGYEIHASVSLQQAIVFSQGHNVTPDEVIETARVFLAYLRGE